MNALQAIATDQVADLVVLKAYERLIKDEWIADARREFVPGQKQPCSVCGRYRSLTHAHHVTPLAMQYRDGAVADHTHVWLCPNHHAAVHLVLSQMVGKRLKASHAITGLLSELVDAGEYRAVIDIVIAGRLAHADALEAWQQSRVAAA